MPMPKNKIDELLAQPNIAVLAVTAPDGAPHAVPTWYEYDQGEVVFQTARTAFKYRCLARDPRITLCIDTKVAPYKAVILKGRVTMEERVRHRADAPDGDRVPGRKARSGVREIAGRGEGRDRAFPPRARNLVGLRGGGALTRGGAQGKYRGRTIEDQPGDVERDGSGPRQLERIRVGGVQGGRIQASRDRAERSRRRARQVAVASPVSLRDRYHVVGAAWRKSHRA